MSRRLLGASVVVAGGAAAVLLAGIGGSGGAGFGAHLWVDADGGACERIDTAGGYSDAAACGTVDAAWDAARAGDTIRVRADRYPAQNVTGDKAAETSVIGDDGTTFTPAGAVSCGFQGGVLCANGDNMTLANVTLAAGETHGQSSGAEINGDDVTFRDVDVEGAYVSMYVVGTGFTWQKGTLGANGTAGAPRSPPCDGGHGDGQPLWIESTATGTTIDGVRINPQRSDQTPRSCSANGFHLEDIRIEAARDVTIRRVHFMPGSEAGSGHIFVTSATASATAADGLVLERNIFTPVVGNYAIQVHPNVTNCGWVVAHNTLMQPLLLDCDSAGAVWKGNTGPAGALPAVTPR